MHDDARPINGEAVAGDVLADTAAGHGIRPGARSDSPEWTQHFACHIAAVTISMQKRPDD